MEFGRNAVPKSRLSCKLPERVLVSLMVGSLWSMTLHESGACLAANRYICMVSTDRRSLLHRAASKLMHSIGRQLLTTLFWWTSLTSDSLPTDPTSIRTFKHPSQRYRIFSFYTPYAGGGLASTTVVLPLFLREPISKDPALLCWCSPGAIQGSAWYPVGPSIRLSSSRRCRRLMNTSLMDSRMRMTDETAMTSPSNV